MTYSTIPQKIKYDTIKVVWYIMVKYTLEAFHYVWYNASKVMVELMLLKVFYHNGPIKSRESLYHNLLEYGHQTFKTISSEKFTCLPNSKVLV